MKKTWILSASVLVLLCAAAGTLAAQEEERTTRLFFGPRAGVSVVIQDPATFNAGMQVLVPDTTKTYFPVFTEMGLQSQQLVSLGSTNNYLAFQEMLLIGGLDQSLPLVSVNATMGYRNRAGLEVALGPYVSAVAPAGTVKLTASVVYAVGWTIASKGFSVPVTLMFVPLPSYVNPRVSLLFGFIFESLE
jgi:hypothetical protein